MGQFGLSDQDRSKRLGRLHHRSFAAGEVRRERKENEAGRLRAEEQIVERQARLEDRASAKHLARVKGQADIDGAYARGLKSCAEIVKMLSEVDPEDRERIVRSYGDRVSTFSPT